MANSEHLTILQQGAAAWNEWRSRNSRIQPDLFGANLRGVDLSEADLTGANLIRANLFRADLVGAILRRTNLTRATLRRAYLSEANLCRAILTRTILCEAFLDRADLREANLFAADLSGASLHGANLGGTNLSQVSLIGTDLTAANLSEVNLRQAILVETNLERASLVGCSVYGISARGLKAEGATQASLKIHRAGGPTIMVDNLEVAQFLMWFLNHGKNRDLIRSITTFVILILGRFTWERKPVLDAIQGGLGARGYVPVVFDFDRPTTRETPETLATLARLARFVIADITEATSIPGEFVSLVESLPSLLVQPLLKIGSEPWKMFDRIGTSPWVLEVFQYRDEDDLRASMGGRVIAPVEARASEREKK